MMMDTGRSPDGSGYSAEPEPSSTVSAVPVSIPNATLRDQLSDEADLCRNEGADDIAALLDEARDALDRFYCAGSNLRQAQRDYMEVRNGPREERETFGRLVAEAADELDDVLASVIGARSDATPKSGAAEGESAVAKPDAHGASA